MDDAAAETRAMATNIRGGDSDDEGMGGDYEDEETGLGAKLGVPAVGPDGAVDLDLVKRRLKQVGGNFGVKMTVKFWSECTADLKSAVVLFAACCWGTWQQAIWLA
jgi:hypothetical protein